jgi:hypothetical protein
MYRTNGNVNTFLSHVTSMYVKFIIYWHACVFHSPCTNAMLIYCKLLLQWHYFAYMVSVHMRLTPYLNRMTFMFLLCKMTWIYSAQKYKPALSLGLTLNLLPRKSVGVGSAEVRGARQPNGLGAGLRMQGWTNFIKKKFWEELIACFPLIRHGPHRNRRVQQFIYCCVCIRCRVNVFTEPLPSNDRMDTHTDRLMGGIYEAGHWDALRCHDIHNKFHKD